MKKAFLLLVLVHLWFHPLSNFNCTQGFFAINSYKEISTTHVEHATIYINGNNDFSNQANTEGWPGEGTALNPYVISGYEITGSGSENLIDIRGTNIYFRISNCRLDNGYYGIHLHNVTNGEVSNNDITNSEEGIRLCYSENIEVTENTLSDNIYGISLYYSGNNIITSNTLITGGLYLFGEEFSEFIQSEVSENTVNGAPIVFWQGVSGRTIPMGAGQIFLINCASIEVTGQNLAGFSVGLVTAFSSDINIYNNTISNNFRGAYLRLSENITVVNNSFNDNERGLFLSDSSDNTIINNTFVKDGLYIYGGRFEEILQTNVSNNIVNGKSLLFWQNIEDQIVPVGVGQVILINCTEIEVRDQKLDNSAVGLIAHYCTDLRIINNSMDGNYWGIYMEHTNNSVFTRNKVSNNSRDGVYLEDSLNNYFIFNYFISNSGNRHVFNYGDNNTFTYNYWSDLTSPDNNRDGILDNSYSIPGYTYSYDNSPLASPNTHLLFPPTIVHPKELSMSSGVVTICWTAALDSLGHQTTYSIYYSLDGDTWIPLASNLTNTTYNWDTANIESTDSIYAIKIVATCSEGFTVEIISHYKTTYNGFYFLIDLILISFIVLGLFILLAMIVLFAYFGYYRNRQRKVPLIRETTIQERYIPPDHELEKVAVSHERIEPSKDLPTLKPVIEKPVDFVSAALPKKEPFQKGKNLVDEEKMSLLSSVQYRVQDLIYEPSDTGLIVYLIPYSGLMKKIKIEFENKQIIMSGHSKRDDFPKVTLEMKTHGEPRGPSWGDPWRDITMTGDKEVITKIKIRSVISNSLNSLGTALVNITSPVKGEIHIKITCNETRDAVKHAYSLITDLQSFFEIS
ncbi:MAG: right-handed parallel beta-helix repeat-containing protein [Candidatus Heimdallarchaeota archaeon]|nr:MAG: right-handed parallel beta-helix repeat-containing protein [Candidatus Heimdallarchaeota archaeon]